MEVDSEAQQQQREEAGASRERHAAVGALVTSEEGTEDATAENVPVSASSSEEQVPGSVEEDRDNTAVQQQDEEDVATGDEGKDQWRMVVNVAGCALFMTSHCDVSSSFKSNVSAIFLTQCISMYTHPLHSFLCN